MNVYLFRVLFALQVIVASEASGSNDRLSCAHFWKNGDTLIASGKDVGVDVGRSPFGSAGLYRCSLSISQVDVERGRYIYFGEIGDASYAKLVTTPRGKVSRLSINHGLSAIKESKPDYLRFLPFVVPLHELFEADGLHEVELHYLDIMPPQSGIRGGYPTIESSKGVLHRALLDSPSFTYHLVQTLCFTFFALAVLAWKGLPWKNRLTLFLCSLFSGSVIFSITAIPRFILTDPWFAMRINDSAHLFGFAFIFTPLFFFTNLREIKPLQVAYGTSMTIALCAIAAIWLGFSNSTLPYEQYAIFLAIEGGGFPALMALYAYRGKLRLNVGLSYSNHLAYVLTGFAAMNIWDCFVNLLLLDARYPVFISHIMYFLPAIVWQFYLQLWHLDSQKLFSEKLDEIKNKTLDFIASDKGESSAFNGLARMLGDTLHASRISLAEIVDDKIKFLGTYGSYSNVDGLHPIVSGSALRDTLKSGSIFFGSKIDEQGKTSEYHLVPLKCRGMVRGVLSVTGYRRDFLPRFISQRMAYVQSQCELLFSLLISGRDNRAQSTLLQMARLRVHPLQLKSERYFLDHLRISGEINAPAFILGDLVDSTPLNDFFGAMKVQAVIDQYLADLFEQFRHCGLIISRSKGDEISITFPNQQSDKSSDDVLIRAFEVIQDIVSSDRLEKIARANGIGVPFQFKCAASQSDVKLSDSNNSGSILSFSLMSDSQIDIASRVVSKVALPSECILLARAAAVIQSKADIVRLSPERLKGVRNTSNLFLVNKSTSRKISA